MTATTLAGYSYNTNSYTYRFVEPFIQMVKLMRENKHINREHFKKLYSLTDGEFFDLIGKCEEFTNEFINV